MKNIVVYVHGKGGSVEEAEHYKLLFPESEVIGFDYHARTPWDAKEEFPQFFARQRKHCDSLTVVANSIGAFLVLSSLDETLVDKAYFISPVVNMEKLICDMMSWSNVTEQELAVKAEIPTNFGETLSWNYLCYVREHPIEWSVPTCILYGEHDNLTGRETITTFAKQHGAELTVMGGGEHWFHTEEQMRFLDHWITTPLLDNIEKIHTTPMGAERLSANLHINAEDAVAYCKAFMLSGDCWIYRQGKNWYCESGGVRITVNAKSYTIITAHRMSV